MFNINARFFALFRGVKPTGKMIQNTGAHLPPAARRRRPEPEKVGTHRVLLKIDDRHLLLGAHVGHAEKPGGGLQASHRRPLPSGRPRRLHVVQHISSHGL